MDCASVHSHIWPVTVTVTKRALLSNTLPLPKSTADENFNHNYFIIEEESFSVQLTLVMETVVHQFIF